MPTVEIYTGEPRQAKIKEVKLRLKDVHIKLKDFRLIDKGANIGYGLELDEDMSRQVNYGRSFTEGIEVNEALTKEFNKIIYIDFKVEELLTKLFTKYVEENAEFNESLVKEANKFVSDALELKESLAKDVEMTVKYNLELEELKEKFVEKFFTNKVELQESLSKAYELNLKEAVELKETKSKELSKTFNEVLNIIEIYLRHAGTVMSDLTIYAKALNETDFDVAITPAGYDRFKTMLTGDYIYQRALFRFVLNAVTVNNERPNARKYLHKVDVPDTIETGIIEFKTDENPATYYFTREFHVVPEVIYTILRVENMEELGQAVILPLEVTTKYIKAQLKIGSVYVNGAVSFSARGY